MKQSHTILSVVARLLVLCVALTYTPQQLFAAHGHKPQRVPVCQQVLRQSETNVDTPLLWSVLAPPVFPVKASDGLVHLVYELQFTNLWPGPMQIESIEILDAREDSGDTISDSDIASRLLLTSGNFSDTLPPYQIGSLLLERAYVNRRDVPEALIHRVTFSFDVGSGVQYEATALGGCTSVSKRQAIVLGPPLRGDGWASDNSFNEFFHRQAIFTINGALRIPQRFAIDFLQVDAEDRLLVGDPDEVTNFVAYGAEVLAVRSGRVVAAIDGFPDEKPFEPPTDLPFDDLGGNHVILDLGNGRFAYYAHLMPGSVAVQEGDWVRRGQVLGRLGNSGNTTRPHLHFQVMDGPSPVNANGLPYVFDHWTFQGRVIRESGVGVFEIDRTGSGERRRWELPRAIDIIDFPERQHAGRSPVTGE